MIRRAVILAGGKGTRLASVVADRPKPMADVAGLPFLHYLILDLKSKGIYEIVLLVGYMSELISDYFQNEYHGIKITYEYEHEPRGTGGLIYELSKKWNEDILLINGDTYFDVDIQAMGNLSNKMAIQMAVKEIEQSDRYGVLEINNDKIVNFKEKTYVEKGFINGGVYFIPKGSFDKYAMPYSFSIEKDFFESYLQELDICPFYSKGYFLDIGIPTDYKIAQGTIPKAILPKIDRTWTLFLDRDGVINQLRPLDYVKNLSEFEWIEGSKEAIRDLSKIVGRVVVVTNQQGIGKGLMTEHELENIHWSMQSEVEEIGGKIDRIYYCPYLAQIKPKCRKPEVGMAIQAKEDFPEIDFRKSIMIGDSATDIEFGHKLGMFTILVGVNDRKSKPCAFFDDLVTVSQHFSCG